MAVVEQTHRALTASAARTERRRRTPALAALAARDPNLRVRVAAMAGALTGLALTAAAYWVL